MSVPRSERIRYYLHHTASLLTPNPWCRRQLPQLLEEAADFPDIQERVAYYCPIREPFTLPDSVPRFHLHPWKGRSTYQLDLWETLRFFPPEVQVALIFGDNTENPEIPSLLKSRPIDPGGSRGVLLKLNRIRHFRFVEDTIPYREKQDRLVWRGNAAQPHRKRFLECYGDHPLCDVGHFYHRPVAGIPCQRPELSITQQLTYKFILALEGNDVATNLKWVLSSNSLCLMPPPRFETWFMEGKLQPGVHYVEIAPDYSNVEDKLTYYQNRPGEAEEIIRNANQWVVPFRNERSEMLTSLSVLATYLKRSGQM